MRPVDARLGPVVNRLIPTPQATNCTITREAHWADAGKSCWRITPTAPTSFLLFNLADAGVRGTVAFRAFLPAPLTGTLHQWSRRAYWNPTPQVTTPDAPNVAGEFTGRVFTTTNAPGATPVSTVVFMHGGSAGSGDILLDTRLTVVTGDYRGPLFDGDSPDSRWLGTPGASPSVGYPTLT